MVTVWRMDVALGGGGKTVNRNHLTIFMIKWRGDMSLNQGFRIESWRKRLEGLLGKTNMEKCVGLLGYKGKFWYDHYHH